MSLKKNFGKKIKALRKERKLTQAELAELIGVESLTISRIETGENFVKAETLESLKKVLDVSYAELFDFEVKNTEDPKLKSITVHLKDLDEAGFDFFITCIKAYKKINLKN